MSEKIADFSLFFETIIVLTFGDQTFCGIQNIFWESDRRARSLI